MLADVEIIELYNQRQELAITETDLKYGDTCRKLAYNILKDFQDSEECTNDSYLTMWNKIPPEIPKKLCAFLFRIVKNLALKRYEKNTAKKRNNHYDIALDELSQVIGDKKTPDEELQAKELGKYINSFLKDLSKEQRILFVQRYWYGYSVKDIGENHDLTAHNVTVKLSRIRNKLKSYLEERGYSL